MHDTSVHLQIGLAESLRREMQCTGLPIKISVICPVKTTTGMFDVRELSRSAL